MKQLFQVFMLDPTDNPHL